MKQYRQVLKVPGLRRTIALGWFVKLPVIAIPVVLALQVTLGLDRGLGSAGLVTGAWMLGAMTGSPFLGRAMDRYGMRPVLLVSATAQGLFWATAAALPHPALVGAALLSGLLLVPGSTVVRLVVAARVPAEHRQAGFALDSMTSQLSYLVGPGAAAVLATQLSPAVTTRALGGLLVLGTLALAMHVPARPPTAPAGPPDRPAEPRTGRPGASLLALLACTFAAGTVSSGFEISLLGVLRAEGDVAWVGLLIATTGLYAVAGGFLFGTLTFPVPAWAPVCLLGLVTAPLALTSDWRVLLVVVLPAAVLSASSFAATATAVSTAGPEESRGRTMGLYGSALAGGNALGAPLAGLAAGWAGPSAGFAAIGAFTALVGLTARLALPRPAPPRPAATAPLPDPAGKADPT
ncbi:MFS transporter [Streptomyces sp. NBC_00239]|uniref:MFS transporter n=1 Tax=Streptomyces sp. NBC_00239 TaxID=2903640 RepID=UPI002E2B8384|nr:MFS transporter [Streptomyces sp. NBC_00239]